MKTGTFSYKDQSSRFNLQMHINDSELEMGTNHENGSSWWFVVHPYSWAFTNFAMKHTVSLFVQFGDSGKYRTVLTQDREATLTASLQLTLLPHPLQLWWRLDLGHLSDSPPKQVFPGKYSLASCLPVSSWVPCSLLILIIKQFKTGASAGPLAAIQTYLKA